MGLSRDHRVVKHLLCHDEVVDEPLVTVDTPTDTQCVPVRSGHPNIDDAGQLLHQRHLDLSVVAQPPDRKVILWMVASKRVTIDSCSVVQCERMPECRWLK